MGISHKTEVAFDVPVRVADLSMPDLIAYHNTLNAELLFYGRGPDRASRHRIEDAYEDTLAELYRRRKSKTRH